MIKIRLKSLLNIAKQNFEHARAREDLLYVMQLTFFEYTKKIVSQFYRVRNTAAMLIHPVEFIEKYLRWSTCAV